MVKSCALPGQIGADEGTWTLMREASVPKTDASAIPPRPQIKKDEKTRQWRGEQDSNLRAEWLTR